MRPTIVAFALIFFSGCGGCNKSTPQGTVDAPPADAPFEDVTCAALAPILSGTCEVTAGSTTLLIEGNILTPTTVFHGGQVEVDPTGHVTCVGCNCMQGGETTIVCPDAAVSPGLINTHDHITYTQDQPYTDTGERYEDRQQWREGLDGHHKIPSAGSATADQVRWGELRFLMGGATSIVGSGGQPGLLRNLDQAADLEGLTKKAVDFDTFPLDDSSGTRRTGDCNYGGTADTAASIAAFDAFEPHTSEGIDATAHNEFLCESSTTYDSTAPGTSDNLVIAKTAMIHGVGLMPADYGAMATAGTSLIWSPRSNITLYGDTARVTTAATLGVNIALGTDWMPSGSMNLLRELTCADSFNQTYLNHFFSDKQLWEMVTSNAASLTKMDDSIGVLAPGRFADITIFVGHGKTHRAVIEAQPADVALVMRAGKVLYGDDALVSALATQCDPVDVCGTPKQVCLMTEINKTYSALQTAAGASIYPAFSCDPVPAHEPTCIPQRPTGVAGSNVYTGIATAGDSDGDGIPDASDKCPNVFDPIRPMDNGVQGDADNDGIGDACDPCPLDANTTSCTPVDPNDRDHDGRANDIDNCPDVFNPDQTDTDGDGKGDACDACPDQPNPGAEGCPATIYAIKTGVLPVGVAVEVSHALVTGAGTNGFFVQVKSGDTQFTGVDNSGLFVFTGTAGLGLASATVGARVTIDGTIDSFAGELELDGITAVTVESVGPETPPTPVIVPYTDIITGGPRAATLESVIVQVPMATVTATDPTHGEFTLTDPGSSNLIVNNFMYSANPSVGQNYLTATGILALKSITGGSASKLVPRNAADLVPGAPGLAALSPALSYAKVGTTTNAPTYPTPLTVTLSGPAQGDTAITVMSGDTNSLTVTNVTVLDTQTSVVIPVTAVAQSASVTVTVMLGTQMLTANVRVLAAAEVPQTVTLTPPDTAVDPAGTVQYTAALDIPADIGETIDLAVVPSGAGSLPASIAIAANQISNTFTYTDIATSGTATITATFLASTSNATVTVSTGANHLVINEVDYDQIGSGADSAEYIEIYNPSAQPISLVNKAIYLVNGADSTVYATIDLSSQTSLDPDHYLVIAGAGVNVVAPAKKIDPGWTTNAIQNGSPDGIALVDTSTNTMIDALSYEGSITMAMLPGFTTPPTLVEGTALATSVADSNTVTGSLCRHPNGQDTDNANADWIFCTTLTVGTANP